MKAAVHPRQGARLAALRAYDVLDTPRESDFDEIVELASAICGTPISVVNLIDNDRQWFKAEVGLGVRETPLDTSICSHAILEEDFVEVGDTLLDDRMSDNPLCTGERGLRFYAGALLKTESGLPIGTLCVLDYAPRSLNALQQNALKLLSKQVMTQLDLRLALKRQQVLAAEIDHRVKNSLQSVSGLVQLQRSKSTDPNVRAALEEVSGRIRTISLIHEELYQARANDVVDLGGYVARLTDLLGRNAPDNVTIEAVTETANSTSRHASGVGIIVSEFASNSLKHAFPDGRRGAIRFLLRKVDSGTAELICEDDGVGLTKDPAASEARGLGLRIMQASAAQLGGVIENLSPAQGTASRIIFSLA